MDAEFDPNTAHNKESTAGYTAYRQTPAEQAHSNSATTAMVLGILGDVCFLPPLMNLAGLVLSILALTRANKNRNFARDNGITEDGKNIAGRWCGIIGIALNGLSILFWMFLILAAVVAFAIFAGNVSSGVIGVIPEIF